MRRRVIGILSVLTVGSAVTLAAGPAVAASAHEKADPRVVSGGMAGIHWARGAKPPAARGTKSPNLIQHGGPVITATTTVHPIFWGKSWPDGKTGYNYVQQGISGFYAGVGKTSYLATTAEYYSGTDTAAIVSTDVSKSVTNDVDTSAAPTGAPQTSTIAAEIAHVVGTPVAGTYYPVYVDQPRGHAGYCAWHSSGLINGVTVQFAFFFNLTDDAGCDPQDPRATSGAAEDLAALGNVSGHELSEMVTDPQLNAWYDSQGSENADKCAWTFPSGYQSFTNNTSWKIQGNWSNNAYNNKLGYTFNGSTVQGCIAG